MKETKRSNWAVPTVILMLLTFILAARCFFSFCQTDESFYAALVHRFWTGDSMITDEWNTTQFYVPILLPFYWIFMAIRETTDGALLFFRLLYLLFSAITAFKLFRLIWRETENGFCALVPAAIVLLFCRANIYGVSYYNLCMLCCVSGFCSGADALGQNGKKQTALLVWTGILFACAVLCDPFFAPFLVLMLVIALFCTKKKRETALVFAGIAGMAALYCCFLLSGNSIKDILYGIKYVLDDPEQSSVRDNLLSSLGQIASLSKFVAIPAAVMTVIALLDIHKRKKSELWMPYILLQAFLMAATAVRTITNLCDAIVIPMTVVAFPLMFALSDRQTKLAAVLYLIGIVNAGAYVMASNTGVDAGSVGFCISAAAGIWISSHVVFEIGENQWMTITALTLLSVSITVPMFCQRVIGVYRDAPLTELNTRLEQGPAKGLFTTPEHAEQYNSICNDLKQFSEEYPDGRILYSKNLPWAYLLTPYQYGTSSPWRIHTEVFENYCAVRPENRPDYICILKETVGGWERSPLNRNPGVAEPNAFDYGDAFWTAVLQAPKLLETKYFDIYDARNLWKQ